MDVLRILFIQRTTYIKFYAGAILNNLSEENNIQSRLFKNQDDIGGLITSIVGPDKGNSTAALLKNNINAIQNMIRSLQAGNNNIAPLFANSDEIAKNLSSLIPGALDYNTIKTNFDAHCQYIIDITNLHLQKQYDAEINKYDEYVTHAINLSLLISNAIVPPPRIIMLDERITAITIGVIIFLIILYYILIYNKH